MMRHAATAIASLSLVLALAGCGSQRDLQLAPGQTPPPVAYDRKMPQTSAELLKISPEASPQRNVELRRQSEERADDPFDLPPEG